MSIEQLFLNSTLGTAGLYEKTSGESQHYLDDAEQTTHSSLLGNARTTDWAVAGGELKEITEPCFLQLYSVLVIAHMKIIPYSSLMSRLP